MGDWIAYPHGHSHINKLQDKYHICGIPSLVVIDAKTCQIIDDKARETVDKEMEQAPKRWINK